MQYQHHALRNRSSSSTIVSHMEGPIIAVDGGIDDVTIVQGLLNNPKNAGKRTSDPIAAACLPTHDVLFAPESNMDTLKCLPADARRRHMGTSNTWTSSDAEVPSETDDIVDRSAFVAEYNRLAKKVCRYTPWLGRIC